ncbi:3836_t:CDS:2, partial [Funneliformis mosseae]
SLHQFGQIQQNIQEGETLDESEFIFLSKKSKRHHEDSVNKGIEFITDDQNTEFSSEDTISTSISDEESFKFEDYSYS